MLGWHISIYRQQAGGQSPATWDTAQGARIAVWQTGVDGLGWLNELVRSGKAVDLGGNGYPSKYAGTAEFLLPPIMEDPPEAREHWLLDAGDLVTAAWEGGTVTDRAAVSQCPPGEWLVVEVWDES